MKDESNETLLDLDNASDISLDGIEDLPDFVIPPNGLYVFCTKSAKIVTSKSKKNGGEEKKRLSHIYSIAKIIQLENPSELAPANGSLVSENFTLNKMGLEIWKSKCKAILGDKLEKGMTIGDVLSLLQDEIRVFVGRTRIKETKGDDGSVYENVQINVVRKPKEEDLVDATIPF